MTFRVHLSDGSKKDIDAESPSQAHDIALKNTTSVWVTKVKRLRSAEARG